VEVNIKPDDMEKIVHLIRRTEAVQKWMDENFEKFKQEKENV